MIATFPRPYRDSYDWNGTCELLRQGRKASNGTYYVHTGDLSWWMYHPHMSRWVDRPDPGAELSERLFLWEQSAVLLGWCLLTPDGGFIDVFVRPDLRSSSLEQEMFAWSESALKLRPDLERISIMWICENDAVRTDMLGRRGYVASAEFALYLTRPLTKPVQPVPLPAGFTMRCVQGPDEARIRAAAAHAAFKSTLPVEGHCHRYASFMQSPVYDNTRDLVVIAPDGQVAAFCILWIDNLNKVGLFEPVGTHPEFQCRGIGSSLVRFALTKMIDRGMQTAIVCPNGDNPAAIRLYESQDFKIQHRLLRYWKST